MAEIKEFVINDRRKFTAEGELRPEAQAAKAAQQSSPEPKSSTEPGTSPEQESSATMASSPEPKSSPEQESSPRLTSSPEPENHSEPTSTEATSPSQDDETLVPTAPTAEQVEQARLAYESTVDRLDTAIRATNPGMDRPPRITLQHFIQSLYMQALMQLGSAAAPGQQPQVDLLGARQTIDMLGILYDKTKGNCTPAETRLLDAALFELRIEFLEVTQALTRSAAARQPQSAGPPTDPVPPGMGPRIVR
ncbi:MAG: DUF1844 domain-containing protein [Acidobacteriaceae bacterium]